LAVTVDQAPQARIDQGFDMLALDPQARAVEPRRRRHLLIPQAEPGPGVDQPTAQPRLAEHRGHEHRPVHPVGIGGAPGTRSRPR